MVKRRRARVFLFGALALVAALLPAGLATGSHDNTTQPSVILLELGRNDQVSWLGHTQDITSRRNDCTSVSLAPDPEILTVSPSGGALGFVRDGLGVKSPSDGSGEPCGRVESDESISVALGSEADGFLMDAIDLDVELKFSARVTVELWRGDELVDSFTFMGTDSDDGPDSGPDDNYRLTYGPVVGNLFDRVVLKPTAGSLSLEGGADGTPNGGLAPNNFSQVRVVKTFDGTIDCGQTVQISEDDVVGLVTMHSLKLGSATWITEDCEKNFNDDVTESSISFFPALDNSLARYTMVLTIDNQEIRTDANGQTTSLIMEYDSGTGDRTLKPCNDRPEPADFINNDSDGNGLLPTSEPPEPPEMACYFGVDLEPTGEGVGTEVWEIYFEDDPGFSFR